MLEQTSLSPPLVARSALQTASLTPAARDYPTLFEAQVARTPRATAVTFGSASLDYAEVNRRANRLAHLLIERGVGPEVVVGLLLDRSFEMVLAMLAVQKAGGVCLPLDVSYPEARITYMLEDSDATIVVTDQAHLPRLAAHGVSAVCVDMETSALAHAPVTNPLRTLRASNACQMMFTSGSTGRPKGVTLTHGGLVNFLSAMLAEPGMDENDVILALANYTFDPSIVEIYQPLVCGARAVIVPRDVATDGLALWDLVQEVHPTILNATPATFRMMIEAGWTPGGRDMKVICGGETMTPALAGALLERSTSVWNVYGPTETTALCALQRVLEVEDPIPIGRAMPGMSVHVLDDYGCPVGVGETGEVYIGGACVTRGYLKRDDLTRERFVRDPFDPDPKARLYRSGDLATYRPDGRIVLKGRRDDQLKINGCRIEPGAVESVLSQHPDVEEAVVLARDQQLVAFVVTRPGAADDAAILAMASESLPEFMVPSRLVRLPELPLNANAKVDRRALAEMPLPLAVVSSAPRTPLEERLATIFSRVLAGRAVSMTEEFSTMGLDSLAGVRLARGIEADLGCRLPIALLLRARNLRQLADALQTQTDAAATS